MAFNFFRGEWSLISGCLYKPVKKYTWIENKVCDVNVNIIILNKRFLN